MTLLAYAACSSSGSTTLDAISIAVLAVILVLLSTHAFTTLRFRLGRRGNAGRYAGKEPPTLPYSIPWIGSAFLMRDPHAMYEYLSYAGNINPGLIEAC